MFSKTLFLNEKIFFEVSKISMTVECEIFRKLLKTLTFLYSLYNKNNNKTKCQYKKKILWRFYKTGLTVHPRQRINKYYEESLPNRGIFASYAWLHIKLRHIDQRINNRRGRNFLKDRYVENLNATGNRMYFSI